MTLLEFLAHKLTPAELNFAEKLYKEETKIFMETLERFRKHFQEELKVMNRDIEFFGDLGNDEKD